MVINSVFDRFNTLIRPPICNVDQIVLVLAPVPKPDYMLIDKLIVNANMLNIDIVLVINKADVNDIFDEVASEYHSSVSNIILTSAYTNIGIDKLKEQLKGKFSCLIGQSAVGKSTLLNALNPNINAETGTLSKKIERGKNTTRHSQIYAFDDILIADTPGFSLFDLDCQFDKLKSYYPEFSNFKCKYLDCNHVNEDISECGVISAVQSGLINQNRYDRYKELFLNLKEKWQNKYR